MTSKCVWPLSPRCKAPNCFALCDFKWCLTTGPDASWHIGQCAPPCNVVPNPLQVQLWFGILDLQTKESQ
eukprot:12882800-Prorocentrum_lima.AAC.1